MKHQFPYIVKTVNKEEFDVNYVVEYLDFPGITGGGETQEAAIQMAHEALEMYFKVLDRDGKEIKTPPSVK